MEMSKGPLCPATFRPRLGTRGAFSNMQANELSLRPFYFYFLIRKKKALIVTVVGGAQKGVTGQNASCWTYLNDLLQHGWGAGYERPSFRWCFSSFERCVRRKVFIK